MLEPLGNRVIIFPDPVETETKSGIIVVLNEREERASCSSGTIVGVGPSCWVDPALGGETWGSWR